MRTALTLILCLALNSAAWAYTPMKALVALLAGEGSAGFQDGPFNQAQFNGIAALLLDEEGKRLYVTDKRNAAIRVVHLGKQHHVSTVSGAKGESAFGVQFRKARLQKPGRMVWGANQQTIFFLDEGTHQVMKLSMPENAVTVVSGSGQAGYRNGNHTETRLANPRDLVFLENYRVLLVADHDNAAIRLVETETGETRTLLKHQDLRGIDLLLVDPIRGSLLFTRKNSPGIWTITSESRAFTFWLKGTMPVASWREDIPWTTVRLDISKLVEFDRPLTAWTLQKFLLFANVARKPAHRRQSPLVVVDLNRSGATREIKFHAWLPLVSPGEEKEPAQRNRLYNQASSLAYSVKLNTFYIADRDNDRILSVKKPRHSHQDEFTPAPAAGVTRIVVFGNSYNHYVADIAKKDRDDNYALSLVKRTEYWLNFLSLLRGQEQRYEVLYGGSDGHPDHSVLSRATQMQESITEAYQPHLVLVNFCTLDVVYEAFSYFYKPVVNGQLSPNKDPEFTMQPLAERDLHPLGKRLLKYIRKNQKNIGAYAKMNQGKFMHDRKQTFNMLDNPKNRKIFFKLAMTRIDAYQRLIQDSNQRLHRQVKLVFNTIPLAANLSRQEIISHVPMGSDVRRNFLTPELGAYCQAKGIDYQDCIEVSKIMEPTLFPVFNTARDHHYSKKFADFVGFLTAYQLLDGALQ